MGSFSISSTSNSINAVCEGMFTQQDAMSYVENFKKEAAKVTPAKCHLSLDGSKLSVSPKEMQEILTNVLALYKSMGFNDVTMNLGTNAILKMQISRIASEAGFTDFKVVWFAKEEKKVMLSSPLLF